MDTERQILRCSTGELHPFTKTLETTSNSSSPPSGFSTIATDVWNSHLGHPGKYILRSLSTCHLIDCHKTSSSTSHSCILGKHVKLPFLSSDYHCSMHFLSKEIALYPLEDHNIKTDPRSMLLALVSAASIIAFSSLGRII